MKLYEATNGYTGNSYVRCYVWANDEQEGRELAEESFKNDAGIHGESYWKEIDLLLIVDTDEHTEPFYTDPED